MRRPRCPTGHRWVPHAFDKIGGPRLRQSHAAVVGRDLLNSGRGAEQPAPAEPTPSASATRARRPAAHLLVAIRWRLPRRAAGASRAGAAAMMLRAIISDDEPLAVEGLEAQCERVADVEIVGTAADGEAALCLLETQRPDFLFLDIGMPGPYRYRPEKHGSVSESVRIRTMCVHRRTLRSPLVLQALDIQCFSSGMQVAPWGGPNPVDTQWQTGVERAM